MKLSNVLHIALCNRTKDCHLIMLLCHAGVGLGYVTAGLTSVAYITHVYMRDADQFVIPREVPPRYLTIIMFHTLITGHATRNVYKVFLLVEEAQQNWWLMNVAQCFLMLLVLEGMSYVRNRDSQLLP